MKITEQALLAMDAGETVTAILVRPEPANSDHTLRAAVYREFKGGYRVWVETQVPSVEHDHGGLDWAALNDGRWPDFTEAEQESEVLAILGFYVIFARSWYATPSRPDPAESARRGS